MAAAISQFESKVGRSAGSPLKLLYAGNIGKKQGLLDFCKVLAESKIDFHFRIQGSGGEADAIARWLANSGDSRFQFGPFLEEPEFVRALHECDIFVITEKAGVGASFIPSKLIPCIATGTPVLCICDVEGPLGTEVKEHHLGICLPWSGIQSLAETLSSFATRGDEFTAMQRAALSRSQFYSRETVVGTIERELEKLAATNNRAIPK